MDQLPAAETDPLRFPVPVLAPLDLLLNGLVAYRIAFILARQETEVVVLIIGLIPRVRELVMPRRVEFLLQELVRQFRTILLLITPHWEAELPLPPRQLCLRNRREPLPQAPPLLPGEALKFLNKATTSPT